MASDWVKKYMQSWKADDKKLDADLRRADFVAENSPPFFKALWDQVNNDLKAFYEGGGDSRLIGQFVPSRKFVVTRRDFPMIELNVTLGNGYIEYVCKSKFDHASSFDPEATGQLIITSDLQGRLQVRRNGEPYADHSELSEFLLTPVFEYTKRNR